MQGKMDNFRNICVNEVIPPQGGHKGIRFVHLFECIEIPDEGTSITAGDSKWDLEAYERSGDYTKDSGKAQGSACRKAALRSYEVTANSESLILRMYQVSPGLNYASESLRKI
jgi:hypothetical protein